MPPSYMTEDWYILALYVLDYLMNPTLARFCESFESWEYRTRIRPKLRHLTHVRAVRRVGEGRRAVLLATEEGRRLAWGGLNPRERWARSWDGRWRLLVFDLPEREAQLRLRLWRWLRGRRYGYLQQSVWLSPDPVTDENLPLTPLRLTPESYLVLESRPVPPDSDLGMVRSAWDFSAVNGAYRRCIELAIAGTSFVRSSATESSRLHAWLAAERQAWVAATALDPLLPQALLPPDYRGQEAWQERHATFTLLAHHACHARVET